MSYVLERFLRYVTYDTQSDENSAAFPSTPSQLHLLHTLADELKVLELADNPALSDQFGHDIVTASATMPLDADNKAGVAEIERFLADAMTVTFHGFNTHPGYVNGRMVNAIKSAAAFIDHLPHDTLSPETTSGHDGFVHPYVIQAGVEQTSVRLLICDFATAGLKEKEALIERYAREAAAGYPGGCEAIGRGGTDGLRVSVVGLPTPHLFAGEHNFHGREI